MGLSPVFTDLSAKIAQDYAAGTATRANLGTAGQAFGWTAGLPRTIADFVPTVAIAGMSMPVGSVKLSASTPPAAVSPGSPKPSAVDVSVAPVSLAKYAGKGVCTLEGTLDAAGLIPAIASVLGAGCLLAFESAAMAVLAGAVGAGTSDAASWTGALLGGQADVIAAGGSPGLIVVSAADYGAVIEDLGAQAGFTLDPQSAVGSWFGSAIHVSARLGTGSAYVLDPSAVLAIENENSPMITVDPFSLSANNQIQLVADLVAGLAVANASLISKCTVTG